uniref:Uncharacterized protein n=1 Tax=viral metagenome TaxID=1070528 RepID=A0A6C0AFK6_9ZZZZ
MIPKYIKKSKLFEILEGDIQDVPKKYKKFKKEIEDEEEYISFVNLLAYWMVDSPPKFFLKILQSRIYLKMDDFKENEYYQLLLFKYKFSPETENNLENNKQDLNITFNEKDLSKFFMSMKKIWHHNIEFCNLPDQKTNQSFKTSFKQNIDKKQKFLLDLKKNTKFVCKTFIKYDCDENCNIGILLLLNNNNWCYIRASCDYLGFRYFGNIKIYFHKNIIFLLKYAVGKNDIRRLKINNLIEKKFRFWKDKDYVDTILNDPDFIWYNNFWVPGWFDN